MSSQPDVNTALADLTERRLKLIGRDDERRQNVRLRVVVPLPARFGRIEGTLVDVSARGARMRHRQPMHPGTESRLIFDWGTQWFNANSRVLSTRLVSASDTHFYESRIQFLELPPASKLTLDQVVTTLRNMVLRKWVGNMMGEVLSGAITPAENDDNRLLRYRLVNDRWIVRTAQDDEPQPLDGFILPASVGEEEIRTVCAAYKQLDLNGRQLLRLFAATSIEKAKPKAKEDNLPGLGF